MAARRRTASAASTTARVRLSCAPGGPPSGRRSPVRRNLRAVAATALALGEVDDEGDAVEPVAVPEAVFDEVGVVTGDPGAAVDLDGEPRWLYPDLGHVEHLQPVALARGGLPRL